MDPFQGSYKDGTKPHSFDYRCLSAAPYIFRLLTWITKFTIQVDQFKNPYLSINTKIFILLLDYVMVFMIGIDLIYYNIISVFFPLAFIGGSVPLFYVSILVLNFIFNKRLFGLNIIA